MVFLTLSRTDFKLALKSGLYDLTHARDTYREAATAAGVGLHRDMVLRYFEIQALLLCPVAPHWAEYVWLEVLKKVGICTLPSLKSESNLYSPKPSTTLVSPRSLNPLPSSPPQPTTSATPPPTSPPRRPPSPRSSPRAKL